ncbi:MAG TPA: M23 family metallopeptidase [Clostridia bacterium]|jgi:murein DD-endopeptidase MepM/ murein hydrolase activator NlpD|nr:M23 family metallopeptidase [Clostridia bacterium]
MRITKKPLLFYLISVGRRLSKIKLPKFNRNKPWIRLPGIKGGFRLYFGILILTLLSALLVYRFLPLAGIQNRFSLHPDTGKEEAEDYQPEEKDLLAVVNLNIEEGTTQEEKEPVLDLEEENSQVGKEEEEEELKVSLESGKEVSAVKEGNEEKEVLALAEKEEKSSPAGLKGKLIVPVKGELATSFGMEYNPIFKDWRWHPGLDYNAAGGEPVVAALAGKVINIIDHDYYGWLIVIEHEKGIQTRYGHCQNLKVTEGDRVKQGQVIGEVGMTGLAERPHLHWELWINDEPINPQKYLN